MKIRVAVTTELITPAIGVVSTYTNVEEREVTDNKRFLPDLTLQIHDTATLRNRIHLFAGDEYAS